MGLKLGSLAAGLAAGYMAMGGKKKGKDEPSEKGAKVYRGYGSGYNVEDSTGPDDAADVTRTTSMYTRGKDEYPTDGYANGGLVGPQLNMTGDRHFGKKR